LLSELTLFYLTPDKAVFHIHIEAYHFPVAQIQPQKLLSSVCAVQHFLRFRQRIAELQNHRCFIQSYSAVDYI